MGEPAQKNKMLTAQTRARREQRGRIWFFFRQFIGFDLTDQEKAASHRTTITACERRNSRPLCNQLQMNEPRRRAASGEKYSLVKLPTSFRFCCARQSFCLTDTDSSFSNGEFFSIMADGLVS